MVNFNRQNSYEPGQRLHSLPIDYELDTLTWYFLGRKENSYPSMMDLTETARLWTDKSPHMTELKSAGVCGCARACVLGVQTILYDMPWV